MADEAKQPEGQAEAGGVKADENGLPEVGTDDFLSAVGLDDETEPEPEKQPEKPPAKEPEKKPEKPPEKAEEKPPDKLPEVTKRKIKHQGKEIELDPDKEIELIQKGFDYTQKMQALAAERQQLTASMGLIQAVQKDPELRKKIAEHLTGQITGEPKKPEPPKFDDPIEQLKWETRQEVLKEVEQRFVKPMQQQQQTMTHQQVIDQVRMQVQADPMYAEVQEAIRAEVAALPPTIAQNVYRTYDQNPKAYLEAYQIKRQQIAAKKGKPQEAAKAMPEPVKREERAPILESAGNLPSDAEASKEREALKALNKKARAGDYRALGELLLKGDMLKGIAD